MKNFLYRYFFRFTILGGLFLSINAQEQSDFFTPAPQFTSESHVVYASFFHWYTTNLGQLSGPWRPLEGRESWTGATTFWKSQIKQVMCANIDILLVHLIPAFEKQRMNFFSALYELRQEGYNVPKIAPFLDPLITWNGQTKVDLNTEAGKDTLANQYIRFFNQYFKTNSDEYATQYLAQFDNRIILDIWHPHLNLDNISFFTRSDLESRIQAEFAKDYQVFNNGIYMISTAYSPEIFVFTDERIAQFEVHSYFEPVTYNSIKTVQVKPGYWDQNVRNPGYFMARNGGRYYRNSWAKVDQTYNRVYIESWNEYDEGSGIYAGDPGEPFLIFPNTNDDQWSVFDDPMEYIKTTANYASAFNDYQDYDSKILWHDIPDKMNNGETINAQILIRNEGNVPWNSSNGIKFEFSAIQNANQWESKVYEIDDSKHEIEFYGGVFRGRPIMFNVEFQAPTKNGNYLFNWFLKRDGGNAFGDTLKLEINVHNIFQLYQNYPNPFNSVTKIKYSIKNDSFVILSIYDLQGHLVKTLVRQNQSQGNYEVQWDGENISGSKMPSGIYIYKLNVLIQETKIVKTQKMILMK